MIVKNTEIVIWLVGFTECQLLLDYWISKSFYNQLHNFKKLIIINEKKKVSLQVTITNISNLHT